MKKILLTILLLSLAGCSQTSDCSWVGSEVQGYEKICDIGKKTLSKTDLKAPMADIIYSEDIKTSKGDVKRYYYEGEVIPAGNYKVEGKTTTEDLSKRKMDSETYCNNGTCIMKQYGFAKYSPVNTNKKLEIATTTIDNFNENLGGMLGANPDVSSAKTKEWTMYSQNSPTNHYNLWEVYVLATNKGNRTIVDYTMSADPGGSPTITKVDLVTTLTAWYIRNNTVNVHKLTNTSWSDANATWNNPWTTAGGDYDSTVICHIDITNNVGTAYHMVLQGTGSDNAFPGGPLTWGSDVNLLFKDSTETGGLERGNAMETGTGANAPYLEITYTEVVASAENPQVIIIE